MEVRVYRESDREKIKEITIACFSGASSIACNTERLFGPVAGKDWTSRKRCEIDDDITANPAGILVAEVDESPIGFITTRIDHETKVGWIPNLAVLPDHQQGGIGRALIDAAIAYLRDEGMKIVRIETLQGNEVGSRFYPAYGFKEVARQIHYALRIDEA